MPHPMIEYAQELREKTGIIQDPDVGYTLSDWKKREEFFEAYTALCIQHGYTLVPDRDGAPDCHNALMVVPREEIPSRYVERTGMFPLFEEDGTCTGWV